MCGSALHSWPRSYKACLVTCVTWMGVHCRRTRQFIQTVLPKMGISATVIDPADMDGLEQALKTQRVSLFFSGHLPPCACTSLSLAVGAMKISC